MFGLDTFTFVVALLLMMLAVQFGENWLVFSVFGVMVITMRSLSATMLMIVALVLLYVVKPVLGQY